MARSANAQHLPHENKAHRLRDAFERLAMPREALLEHRARPAETYEALIKALVGHIDETVLPRRLALLSGDAIVATLVLSNRRLTELELDGNPVQPATEEDADPDAVARSYARAFKTLMSRAAPLEIRLLGRAAQAETSSTACSAERLAEFGAAARFENRLKAFLKPIHRRSLGWIYRPAKGEAVAHAPDTGMFERLRDLDTRLDQAKDDARQASRSGPVCAAFALGGDVQVIVARDEKDRVILALPEAQLPAALSEWQRIFGRAL